MQTHGRLFTAFMCYTKGEINSFGCRNINILDYTGPFECRIKYALCTILSSWYQKKYESRNTSGRRVSESVGPHSLHYAVQRLCWERGNRSCSWGSRGSAVCELWIPMENFGSLSRQQIAESLEALWQELGVHWGCPSAGAASVMRARGREKRKGRERQTGGCWVWEAGWLCRKQAELRNDCGCGDTGKPGRRQLALVTKQKTFRG